MTRYNPGSNTKDWGGNTTRGWRRWERAARNALRNPMSANAQVYRDRTTLALEVASARAAMGDKDGAWQFIGTRYVQREGSWATRRTRMYSTCSTFCTVLQITLDFNAHDLPGVAKAFALKEDGRQWGLTVSRLDPKTLRKSGVQCCVCTRRIKP